MRATARRVRFMRGLECGKRLISAKSCEEIFKLLCVDALYSGLDYRINNVTKFALYCTYASVVMLVFSPFLLKYILLFAFVLDRQSHPQNNCG